MRRKLSELTRAELEAIKTHGSAIGEANPITQAQARTELIERDEKEKREDITREEQRHKEAISENRKANRLSRLAIAIALVAVAISIAAWIFPRAPLDTNQPSEAHSLASPQTLTNMPPAIAAPMPDTNISTIQPASPHP